MLVWVIRGHDYHAEHALKECLFCTNILSIERMAAIQNALDGGIDRVIAAIDGRRNDIQTLQNELDTADAPSARPLTARHTKTYDVALATYNARMNELKRLVEIAAALLNGKRKAPGVIPDVSAIPDQLGAARIVAALLEAQAAVNAVIEAHNQDVDDFTRLQDDARLAIRKHYLAQGWTEYQALLETQTRANAQSIAADTAHTELLARIQALEGQIREHGPAANAINRLLHSYLGHVELSIAPVAVGYEIRRNDKLIAGLPSEGEKTAIALCYFLSMLESERRKTADLIVVVDDPISSLDSRSLNFACNLIKSRLTEAAQLFVLTHNQNCLNEFRKPWKSKARPLDGKEPTAALFFLDVAIRTGAKWRTSNIVELPALLREYDSEYHYLFRHVLNFEGAKGEYDYAYMMPNVLRRVLELFLAFRCPGNSALPSKIDQLCKLHPGLDRDRIVALERLTQVESHSDNLDDLIGFSSMALEETRDATSALLTLMEEVDAAHVGGLRRICA
jgi:wobble nucleotide-excising tRNase